MAELLRLKNNQPLFQSPDINPPDLTRLSLRKIARTPGKNWKLLESGIPTHALPEWFERHVSFTFSHVILTNAQLNILTVEK